MIIPCLEYSTHFYTSKDTSIAKTSGGFVMSAILKNCVLKNAYVPNRTIDILLTEKSLRCTFGSKLLLKITSTTTMVRSVPQLPPLFSEETYLRIAPIQVSRCFTSNKEETLQKITQLLILHCSVNNSLLH